MKRFGYPPSRSRPWAKQNLKEPDHLGEIIRTDPDTRMVCSALRAMNNFDYSRTKPIILAALRNKDISIARTALDYLANFGRVADAGEYRNIARENLPWQVKIPLLGIANENYSYAYAITKGNINAELKSILSRAAGIDEKMACLRALATDPKNYNFILETGRQSVFPPFIRRLWNRALTF
jgi:hypothetical protein